MGKNALGTDTSVPIRESVYLLYPEVWFLLDMPSARRVSFRGPRLSPLGPRAIRMVSQHISKHYGEWVWESLQRAGSRPEICQKWVSRLPVFPPMPCNFPIRMLMMCDRARWSDTTRKKRCGYARTNFARMRHIFPRARHVFSRVKLVERGEKVAGHEQVTGSNGSRVAPRVASWTSKLTARRSSRWMLQLRDVAITDFSWGPAPSRIPPRAVWPT